MHLAVRDRHRGGRSHEVTRDGGREIIADGCSEKTQIDVKVADDRDVRSDGDGMNAGVCFYHFARIVRSRRDAHAELGEVVEDCHGGQGISHDGVLPRNEQDARPCGFDPREAVIVEIVSEKFVLAYSESERFPDMTDTEGPSNRHPVRDLTVLH